MARPILLDNDALLKLCAYDLVDRALDSLQASLTDVYVLPTAKYSLLPAKSRLKRCKDEATAVRLEYVLSQAKVLDREILNPDTLDALVSFPGIDPGEALLITFAAEMENALIVTGDKRAIAALAGPEELEKIAEQLEGKVCVLEVLFMQIVKNDFEKTQQMVRAKPEVDKALTYIFGSAKAAPFESVLEGLDSHINHMREHTGRLLTSF